MSFINMLTDRFEIYKPTTNSNDWGFSTNDSQYSTTPSNTISCKLITQSSNTIYNNSEPYINTSDNPTLVYQNGESLEKGDKVKDIDTDIYYICGKPKPIRRAGGSIHHMEVKLAIESNKQ